MHYPVAAFRVSLLTCLPEGAPRPARSRRHERISSPARNESGCIGFYGNDNPTETRCRESWALRRTDHAVPSGPHQRPRSTPLPQPRPDLRAPISVRTHVLAPWGRPVPYKDV